MKYNFFNRSSILSICLLCSVNFLITKDKTENEQFFKNFFSYVDSDVVGFRIPKNLVINGDFQVNQNGTVGGFLCQVGHPSVAGS